MVFRWPQGEVKARDQSYTDKEEISPGNEEITEKRLCYHHNR